MATRPSTDPQVVAAAHDALRQIGSVEQWCLTNGAMLGHTEAFSAKVSRIITLGCTHDSPVPQQILEAVPQATKGLLWIGCAAEGGFDLQTFRCLARLAVDFREDMWSDDRQEKFSKYAVEAVSATIQFQRIVRSMEQLDREGMEQLDREANSPST